MDYPKSQPDVYLHQGKFTDGTADGTIPPSRDPAQTQNDIIDSILAVQTAGGLAHEEGNINQLRDAILAMIAAKATNTIPVAAKAAAYTAVAADRAKLLDCTGTFSLSFTAAATLADGWWCAVRNSGTGTITLDPNGAELIDGASTATLAPGESCIVVCSGGALFTVGKTVAQAGYGNRQIFSASGTFTVPAGVTRVFVEVWGGGGGGGGGDTGAIVSASGGGGGGYANKIIAGLLPGTTVSVTIGGAGTPGAGASGGSIGGTGGTSSFGAHCSATGGAGGDGRVISGNTSTFGNPGGAGGAAGQMSFDGAQGDTSGAGGAGARGAGGGAGVRTKGDVAQAGVGGGTPGGGGSGGIAYGGGWGGAGMVIVWW
jgi:hypothetical protein